jgi:serine/threonine-protein kinase
MNSDADRQLLFGLVALQNGLIDQDQLVAAFQAWTRAKGKTLAEHLGDRGNLDAEQRGVIEAMVSLHVKKHGDDVEKSLASINAGPSTRELLTGLGDTELTATVSHLASDSDSRQPRDVLTANFRISTATGDGQRFRVLRPHARGGLGAVFVALDEELHREVALKQILDSHADDEESRRRFLLEAEITGGLEHPGIVPVYGLGSYRDGRPYYAMRFIRGDSLKEAIERFHKDEAVRTDPGYRSLELRKLLRRFTDVCNAIDYAHSRGVVHRDIKPGNIIVGKYGETLVVDWGLAKPLGRVEPDRAAGERTLVPSFASGSAETMPGSALGTPAYMSPEQAFGDLDRLGPRSDVYALGSTLYCLLTGRPPFTGDDVLKVIRSVRQGEFAAPRQLDPSIDRALEAVCLKAMALEPEDRYPTCRALADDVERWTADEPVAAFSEPWTRRFRRWTRRNRTVVSAAAAAAIVAVVGLGTVAAVQTEANRRLSSKNVQLTEANEARARALNKADARVGLALGALERFRETVAANLDVQNRPENAQLRNDLLQTPLAFFKTLRDDLRDDPEARPEDRLKLADAQLELARLAREVGNQDSALEAAGEAAATLEALEAAGAHGEQQNRARLRLMGALELQARLQVDNGRRDAAKQTLDRGVDIGDRFLTEAPDVEPRLGLARLLALRASSEAEASRMDTALATLARARPILDAASVHTDASPAIARLRAQLLDQTADVQSHAGKPKEAIESLSAAVALLEPLVQRSPSDWVSRDLLGEARFHIALNRDSLAQGPEMLEDLKKAIELRRTMGRERPANLANRLQLVNYLDKLARKQAQLGLGTSSLETFSEARAILEAARHDNPRNARVLRRLISLLNGIGGALYTLGRVEETLATFEQNASVIEELVKLESHVAVHRRTLAGNLYNIGALRHSMGRGVAALEAENAALAIRRQLAVEFPNQPDFRFQVAASLGNIGVHLIDTKHDYVASVACYREAECLLAALVSAYPDVVVYREYLSRCRGNMGSALVRLGRFEAALAAVEVDEPFLAERVKVEPKLVQARIDLTNNLAIQSGCLSSLGRYNLADRVGQRALETLAAVPASNQRFHEVVRASEGVWRILGELSASRGRLSEAQDRFSRSILAAQPDPSKPPADASARETLRESLRGRAEASARLGQLSASRADWARLVSLREAGDPDIAPLISVLIRAWSGDAAAFLTEAEAAIVARSVPRGELITFAGAACRAVTDANISPNLVDRLGASAVAWLRIAEADGAFLAQGSAAPLFDARFDPIARRADFRALRADLAFPADPFAPATR